MSIPYLTEAGYLDGIKRNTLQKIQKIIALEQTRMKKLLDIVDTADFFFKQNDYDITKLLWKDMRKLELQNILFSLDDIIKNIDLKSSWDKENLEKIIMPEAEKLGDRGKMLWPLRYALSGKDKSPGPFEIMEIIGKEATIAVIKKAQNKIAKLQK